MESFHAMLYYRMLVFHTFPACCVINVANNPHSTKITLRSYHLPRTSALNAFNMYMTLDSYVRYKLFII